MTRNVLTAEQTARRLGVKLETVYAYVSRGLLARTLAEDGRTSRFETSAVEALARRGKPRREQHRQGIVDVSLATAITGIHEDRLLFRGHDATHLATSSSFEAVSELLWTGELAKERRWSPSDKSRVALSATKALTADAGPLDRLSVAVAALSSVHPLRVNLSQPTVVEHARALLSTYAAVLPFVGAAAHEGRVSARSFVSTLFPRVSPLPQTAARVALLDATLVLLADHELATSTLAARVAASTRADPFSVVLAGLGAVSGPLHGKAATLAHRMIVDAASSSAELAVARAIETWSLVPGFRHPVYKGMDPRARCLLDRLSTVVKGQTLEVIFSVARAGGKSSRADPNVDFALAAVAFALQMPVGMSAAVFAIARTSGWIAHALEEYGEEPLRFRAHSIYVGPSP